MRSIKENFQKDLKAVNSVGFRGEDINIELMKPGNGFCELIENAGGVPFQLIFGPEPGTGYYVYMGSGIKELTGLDANVITEELFLKLILEVKPLSDHIPAAIREARDRFKIGEIRKYKVELLIQTPDGKRRWIHDTSLPLTDDETGNIIGSYGILFDITEKKYALANLQEANIKSEDCERLKDAFLQNISHEVRTPLNAIIGFSTLLCEQDNDFEKKQEFCNIINSSTDHFLEVMDNILEISRIETKNIKLNIGDVDIDDLMLRLYDRFISLTNRKKILLGCDIPSKKDYLPFRSDGFKIFQVMNNLLSNALKFTSEGEILYGFRKKDSHIEFFVTDTGIGINEKFKPLLFTKFFQADSGMSKLSGGLGLGLAISKSYVQMLGGEIDFSSDPGKGSTFRFTLPV
jgi:signal transduction histidine kinase